MKLIRVIGLVTLICFTFFYTEKIIDVSIMQDNVMIEINENKENFYIKPIDAIIDGDTIVPGKVGKEIDVDKSYLEMKKVGYYEESLLKYREIYPEKSIYNNYNKYIISGNKYQKKIALVYIINSNIKLNRLKNYRNIKFNLFIDATLLHDNMEIINYFKNSEIYNYGNNGKYTMDNLIISNNIINNKANNNAVYCLFTEKDIESLNNCSNNKMLSIMPSINGDYNMIKNEIMNGSIILINNLDEVNNIVRYVSGKGYIISGLSEIIKE